MVLAEHFANRADSLARAMFVFNQAEADIVVAVFTKAMLALENGHER